jgi:hypothetical protein
MWAIGCLMGELTDGEPLFAGDSDIDQLHRLQRCIGMGVLGNKHSSSLSVSSLSLHSILSPSAFSPLFPLSSLILLSVSSLSTVSYLRLLSLLSSLSLLSPLSFSSPSSLSSVVSLLSFSFFCPFYVLFCPLFMLLRAYEYEHSHCRQVMLRPRLERLFSMTLPIGKLTPGQMMAFSLNPNNNGITFDLPPPETLNSHYAGKMNDVELDFVTGRGLHSSTSQLDLSAFYGIGGACRDCVARVRGVFRVFLYVRHGSF